VPFDEITSIEGRSEVAVSAGQPSPVTCAVAQPSRFKCVCRNSPTLTTILVQLFGLRPFQEFLLDRHAQTRPLRHVEVTIFIKRGWILENLERILVVADGHVVEDFEIRRV
jgi:hypothetical protein